jgi:phospholipid-binding lipoprotein MlaA
LFITEKFKILILLLVLANPVYAADDALEFLNRKTFAFNEFCDELLFTPLAEVYNDLMPNMLQKGIDNFFNNIAEIPTIANDILQLDAHYFINDIWRLIANSTLGLAGLFDPASGMALQKHENDFGLTLMALGYENSNYLVLPILGPSTIRDGIGLAVDYRFLSPYGYYRNIYTDAVLALRFIDLKARNLQLQQIITEAPDRYAFVRDAYLSNRKYKAAPDNPVETSGADYVD